MARDIQQIIRNCDRFLSDHHPRTVRQLTQAVADSSLSLIKNDQYGRGGYVNELEAEVAELLGKEAAVFMPSGTMAQPIALRIWADRCHNKTVAFHPTCHLEIHEHKAYRELHGLEAILLGEPNRLFTFDDLKTVNTPVSSLLIELPQREIGGQLPTWEELTAICDLARSRGMKLHLDGARLWESAPFLGKTYSEIAGLFDSVYVSFYKILGGLPGAILAGPADFIAEAKIWQRRHGGNLQQQSPSAISAKLGLEEHLPKIPEYVRRAGEYADALRGFDRIRIVPEHPPTNMMHLYISGDIDRLVQASLDIAEQDTVAMFFGLAPGGKYELRIGDGSRDLPAEEVKHLFAKLFEMVPERD